MKLPNIVSGHVIIIGSALSLEYFDLLSRCNVTQSDKNIDVFSPLKKSGYSSQVCKIFHKNKLHCKNHHMIFREHISRVVCRALQITCILTL